MLKYTCYAICLVLICCGSTNAQKGKMGQTIDLFDGETLNGWSQKGGQADYAVENGMIVGTTVPNTPNSFLCTEAEFADFVLTLEFKVDEALNSGVQIRSESLADYKNGRVHGYQVEIDASDRAWTSGIYDESRRGWLNDLKENDAARYAFKQHDWNELHIQAIGDRIQTKLNGVPAADLTDSETLSGFIALQVHGVGGRTDPLQVRWRNIRLTPVLEAPIDLTETSSEPLSPKSLVENGAEIKKVAEGFRFTEGPALGPDGKIYFSDIPNNRIYVFDPESGETNVFRENSGGANGLMWTANDALIACEGKNRRVTRQAADGEVTVLAEAFEGINLNSPNDLAMDGAAGIYFTDPRYGNRDDMDMDVEAVYFMNRQRKISRIIEDMTRPNGLVLSHDNQTLYVADTSEAKIWKFNVSKPGQPKDKTLFAETGSDGMTIDEHGNIYCTWNKHVIVYDPEGNEIEKIEFPEGPANVTFGGPDNKTIFVTARTSLYSLRMNVSGGRAYANPE